MSEPWTLLNGLLLYLCGTYLLAALVEWLAARVVMRRSRR